ncbi:leucine-rich repeat protein SHOC-2-like isoform X2 [Colletes gigas]|uniref:leucine-rich repeat protein SHOC-2-like isoform X2 n=1 Tax=Colletes gigas TaxID=935657 RepID=UPI001C9B1B97|nr:leucine-rich repeat protein SHOC-2-like isoform X2 [Colletes gigas]
MYEIKSSQDMFQEYNPENLPCNETLWLRMDASCCITYNPDSNIVLTRYISKEDFQLAQKETIQNLSLSDNQLHYLPANLTESIANLTCLNLSNNRLYDLPDSLNLLKKLTYLNLDYNKFLCIPNVVGQLTSLKTLKAHQNRITCCKNNLETLSNLESLDLSSNQLNDLPSSYAGLIRLRSLRLAKNGFKNIPDCVTNGMPSLQIFDFSQNCNSKIDVPPKSTDLIAFYAERNNICPLFPTWVLSPKLVHLETVSLNETIFRKYDLPEESFVSRVKKLSMKQCKLLETTVDKIIAGTPCLEELLIGNRRNIHKNIFWYMPIETLKKPSNLKVLDASGTEIPSIPKIIKSFVNLSVINVSCNNVNWLPDEICCLKNLSSLIIDWNSLVVLPKNIGELSSLKELKACHNSLNVMPDTVGALTNLQYIDLYDNEFETVPEAVTRLPNLIGMDLEQNYFSTDDLLLNRDVRYENMRDVLREHWDEDCKFVDGMKVQSAKAFHSSEGEANSPSLSRSTTNSSLEKANLFSYPENADDTTNEHWDSSEDSADEFDPHEIKEPRRRVYSPFTFYKPSQRVFCPGESHNKRIITRVNKMLRNGTLGSSTNFEEVFSYRKW